MVLRPGLPPQAGRSVTFLAAVAVAETVGALTGPVRPEVKWPNDVLLGRRKVAGILTEMSSETDRINHVVVGMGVNLNMDVGSAPEEMRKTATSVRKVTGETVDRAAFARALYLNLEKWYKGFLEEGTAKVLDAWRGYFPGEGKPVTVRGCGADTAGVCLGVDPEGALLVRKPGGEVERVMAGDAE